ncbi:hypothetical protein GJ496_001490 [Pomphorhynchus laevis]|nr:hypothetical protein GJ496_001490 [Pomphorhynchus laevis]
MKKDIQDVVSNVQLASETSGGERLAPSESSMYNTLKNPDQWKTVSLSISEQTVLYQTDPFTGNPNCDDFKFFD